MMAQMKPSPTESVQKNYWLLAANRAGGCFAGAQIFPGDALNFRTFHRGDLPRECGTIRPVPVLVHAESQPEITFQHRHVRVRGNLVFDFIEGGNFDQLSREELADE